MSLWICLFQTLHINGIIQYVTFYIWLLSLTIMLPRVKHVVHASVLQPFYGWLIFNCMIYHILLIHLSVDGHLGCLHFWLLWILLWTFIYRFLCEYIFKSFGFIPRGGIAREYDNTVFDFLGHIFMWLLAICLSSLE